jgi:peptidase E
VKRIFAMGGGGFTMEPSNPALDRFILSLAGRPIPRICFLPTA